MGDVFLRPDLLENSTDAKFEYIPDNTKNMSNINNINYSYPTTLPPEASTMCLNEYCVSVEDYEAMLLNYIFPTSTEWVLIVFYVLVCITGVCGNFLVCFAVWRDKSMRTVTNMFIVNLAVADFLVCLICLPPTVLDDVTETWYMGQAMCKIVKYVQGVSVCVSVLTLTSISVERFYAICHPLLFKATTHRARCMILVIWMVSLCIMIPELIVLDIERLTSSTILLTACRATSYPYFSQAFYQLFLTFAMYLVPLCLMGATYGMITKTLWSNNMPSESSQDRLKPSDMKHGHESRAAENLTQQRRKVAKMLIAVVLMFAVCYLPVHLLNILRYAGVLEGFTSINYVALASHCLCYFNSAINPVIYNYMSTKFRQQFSRACLCCCMCCPGMQKVRPRYNMPSTAYSAYRYTNAISHTGARNHNMGPRMGGAHRGANYSSPRTNGPQASAPIGPHNNHRDRNMPYRFKSNITNC